MSSLNNNTNKISLGNGGLPKFDPTPSLLLAVDLLQNAGIPFALIGGVALWAYVPAEEQRLTKDVDLAVPDIYMDKLHAVLNKKGFVGVPLQIGGIALREDKNNIRVDFIDRSVDFAKLYAAAVDEAIKAARHLNVTKYKIPLVSPEYFIAMKIATGEEDDTKDIERLLRASTPAVDLPLARSLCYQHLGAAAANRLDVIARITGHPQARKRYKS
ncbi:MAG: nucleotidyltransferase [Deltaproteobacteria bacterium]|nr:nucleotidyltransferase [Deltaproteobacteria bacterium]